MPILDPEDHEIRKTFRARLIEHQLAILHRLYGPHNKVSAEYEARKALTAWQQCLSHRPHERNELFERHKGMQRYAKLLAEKDQLEKMI